MQRYIVDNNVDKFNLVFTGEQYHHMIRVMRMGVGDQVYAVLGNRQVCIVEITAVDGNRVLTKWVEDVDKEVEMPVDVTIACGLPKGDKIDLIVQKATELGAFSFQFFNSQFSMVKWDKDKSVKKIERLQKKVLEAAEQSHRSHVPKVNPLVSFKELIEMTKWYDVVLVAYEESAKQAEKKQLKQVLTQLQSGYKVLVVFGSEGGLSKEEVRDLEAVGAKLCGLGPRIMRAETAPLYVLSAISYELELGE